MSRIDLIPPPPVVTTPGLFRWFTDLRQALATEMGNAPPLNSADGWHSYDVGVPVHNPVGFGRRGGMVFLRGMIANSNAPTGLADSVIFTLPDGFRPAYRQVHPVLTNGNITGRINVDADGGVRYSAGDTTWISLDNIYFKVR